MPNHRKPGQKSRLNLDQHYGQVAKTFERPSLQRQSFAKDPHSTLRRKNDFSHRNHLPPKRTPQVGPNRFFLYRLSSALDVLQHRPDLIQSVYVLNEDTAVKRYFEPLRQINPKLIEPNSDIYLDHKQPMIMEIELHVLSEQDFFLKLSQEQAKPNVLIADHLQDPHNLGAVLRTAAFYGVPYILIAKDRQCQLTQTVISTSQGGFCFTQIVEVTNITRVLEKLKDVGFWITGASSSTEKPQTTGWASLSPQAIVLGSEAKGLSLTVSKKCDQFVRLQATGAVQGFSLNVSVACGILLDRINEGQQKVK